MLPGLGWVEWMIRKRKDFKWLQIPTSPHGQKLPWPISDTRWRDVKWWHLSSSLCGWEMLIRELPSWKEERGAFFCMGEEEWGGGNYPCLFSSRNLCLGTKGKGGGGVTSHMAGLWSERYHSQKEALDPATSDRCPGSSEMLGALPERWKLLCSPVFKDSFF